MSQSGTDGYFCRHCSRNHNSSMVELRGAIAFRDTAAVVPHSCRLCAMRSYPRPNRSLVSSPRHRRLDPNRHAGLNLVLSTLSEIVGFRAILQYFNCSASFSYKFVLWYKGRKPTEHLLEFVETTRRLSF